MTIIRLILAYAVLSITVACSPMDAETVVENNLSAPAADTKIIWVASHTVDCMGIVPMRCMLVSYEEELAEAQWELEYDAIVGFEFEAGYFHKLEVRIENLPPELVPADASSRRITLVKRLNKEKDSNTSLDGRWTAHTINGNPIKANNTPHLEIDSQQLVVSGSNSCNRYHGKLLQLEKNNIQFGPLATTRMMCQDMSTANLYHEALQATRRYELSGKLLHFFDGQQQAVLVFRQSAAN